MSLRPQRSGRDGKSCDALTRLNEMAPQIAVFQLLKHNSCAPDNVESVLLLYGDMPARIYIVGSTYPLSK